MGECVLGAVWKSIPCALPPLGFCPHRLLLALCSGTEWFLLHLCLLSVTLLLFTLSPPFLSTVKPIPHRAVL